MPLRSPLSKAIGHGSAKHGFSHWWWQRLSAVALIPLTLWFVYSVITLINSEYAVVIAWLSSPIKASLLLLFILVALFHAQTGLQVVIEDYIHCKCVNLASLIAVKFISVLLAVVSVISIFKIVLGG